MAFYHTVSHFQSPFKTVYTPHTATKKYAPQCIHDAALLTDGLLGISVLFVGLFASLGALSLPPAAAYCLIGAGTAYLIFLITSLVWNGHSALCRTKPKPITPVPENKVIK